MARGCKHHLHSVSESVSWPAGKSSLSELLSWRQKGHSIAVCIAQGAPALPRTLPLLLALTWILCAGLHYLHFTKRTLHLDIKAR